MIPDRDSDIGTAKPNMAVATQDPLRIRTVRPYMP